MELEWMDPPAIKHRVSRSQRVLAELQKNPGSWARVAKGLKSGGCQSNWIKLGCEAVSRANPSEENRWDVCARWPAETKPAGNPTPSAQGRDTTADHTPPASVTPNVTAALPRAGDGAPGKLIKPPTILGVKHATAAATGLGPDDPQDQYLARQREKFEADRAARIARAGRKSDYAKVR